MDVALFGGSGLVGQSVLELLLKSDQVGSIIYAGRSSWKGQSSKVSSLIVDFENLPDIQADVFICTLGTTIKKAKSKEAFKKVDLDYVCNLATLAEKVGAKKFLVVSAMGADAHSKFFYNQVKGEMEKFVMDRKIPTVVVFRPSLLIGERKESRLLEDISQKISPLLDFVLPSKYKSIRASNVAKAIVDYVVSSETAHKIVESNEMQ